MWKSVNICRNYSNMKKVGVFIETQCTCVNEIIIAFLQCELEWKIMRRRKHCGDYTKIGPLELLGARTTDLVDIWLTNDARSWEGVVNDHRNVKRFVRERSAVRDPCGWRLTPGSHRTPKRFRSDSWTYHESRTVSLAFNLGFYCRTYRKFRKYPLARLPNCFCPWLCLFSLINRSGLYSFKV